MKLKLSVSLLNYFSALMCFLGVFIFQYKLFFFILGCLNAIFGVLISVSGLRGEKVE